MLRDWEPQVPKDSPRLSEGLLKAPEGFRPGEGSRV